MALKDQMTSAERIPMVDMSAEYAEVGAAVEEAVIRVLRSGQYILGPETSALEAEVAEYVGARFAVGVGSGTDALILALWAVAWARGRGDPEPLTSSEHRSDPLVAPSGPRDFKAVGSP